jgi:hypothetical protein
MTPGRVHGYDASSPVTTSVCWPRDSCGTNRWSFQLPILYSQFNSLKPSLACKISIVLESIHHKSPYSSYQTSLRNPPPPLLRFSLSPLDMKMERSLETSSRLGAKAYGNHTGANQGEYGVRPHNEHVNKVSTM